MRTPTIDEQIRCVQREIAYRARVYSRLVNAGKMQESDAEREVSTMTAVLATLQRVREEQRPGLFK